MIIIILIYQGRLKRLELVFVQDCEKNKGGRNMRNKIYIQAMVVLGVLLALSPLYVLAAGAGAADQQTAAQALSSEKGTTWVCTYQEPERAKPQYIRGRGGQLEYVRRPERTGQMRCKATTGDEVKVFGYCPS
jgi:hypothetical protein